jgi:hypothetical protein
VNLLHIGRFADSVQVFDDQIDVLDAEQSPVWLASLKRDQELSMRVRHPPHNLARQLVTSLNQIIERHRASRHP